MSKVKILLGGIEFGDKYSDCYLNPPVSGLFIPPIRTSSGNMSGRDGGWVSSQFYGMREIVLNGTIICPDAYGKLCELQHSIGIRELLPMYVMIDGTDTYLTEVRLTDFKMDLNDLEQYEFEITVVAPDPSFYVSNPDDPNAGWVSETINARVGGGYETPFVLPVTWEAGSTLTVINNTTNFVVYPQIILTGAFTNPRITNLTTGDYIEAGITTTTETIFIDNKQHIMTLNGGSILPYMDGSWWGLVPGQNTIELSSDGGSDDKSGTIKYRLGYMSIFGAVC